MDTNLESSGLPIRCSVLVNNGLQRRRCKSGDKKLNARYPTDSGVRSKAATRVYHIIRTGRDVKIVPFAKKTSPSNKETRTGNPVPGSSAPAKNLYAVSQALTWIAGQRHDLEEQLAWQRDVPELMRRLEKSPH